MSAEAAVSQPPKYSRYRSVRKASSSQSTKSPTPSSEKTSSERNESIQRSMSRYRRPRTSHPSSEGNAPPLPVLPQQVAPASYWSDVGVRGHQEGGIGGSGYNAEDQQRSTTRSDAFQKVSPTDQDNGQNKLGRRISRGGQQMLANDIPQRIPLRDNSDSVVQDAEQRLAEQKRKDLERLEAELDAAVKSPTFSASETLTSRLEKLKALTRNKDIQDPVPTLPPVRKADIEVNGENAPRSFQQSNAGVTSGYDAPKSSVNSGERRVLIRCKQSSISLPVFPETTTVDLIHSATNVLSQSVAPSAAILIESYTKLGLERRIRRYEYIRDIMNSWDRDTQNSILLQASDSPGYDYDLEESHVPQKPPSDVTVYMYHSQTRGKWNKRYVTVLSSGQVFISKKANSKSTDKNVQNICHLSDFDIYTPATEKVRKSLRLPRKYCQAIRSQQKTTIFESRENYVHFFSTDDAKVDEKWHTAVQLWRSWYLLHKIGSGPRTNSFQTSGISQTHPQTGANPSTKRQSIDRPYLLGSFKSLGLDSDQFETTSEDEEENRPRQIPFHLRNSISSPPLGLQRQSSRHHPPPVTYGRKNLPPNDFQRPHIEDGSTFAPSGLLGKSYSIRQQALKERELQAEEGPFVSGPSLLNGSGLPAGSGTRPKTSVDGGQLGHNLRRSLSLRPKDRPGTSSGNPGANGLVGISVDGVAPHWRGEIKGHGIAAPSGVPLVEVAGGGERDLEGRTRTRTGTIKGDQGAFIKGGLLDDGGV